jgi:hypothetical protein
LVGAFICCSGIRALVDQHQSVFGRVKAYGLVEVRRSQLRDSARSASSLTNNLSRAARSAERGNTGSSRVG